MDEAIVAGIVGAVVGATLVVAALTLARRPPPNAVAPSGSLTTPALILVGALAAVLGGTARLVLNTDAVLVGIVAGATVAYAGFTLRLVQAGEAQTRAIQQQLTEEAKRAAQDREAAQLVAIASAKAHLDGTAPTVTVKVDRTLIEFHDLATSSVEGVSSHLVAALKAGTLRRSAVLHVDLRVHNYGPTPALIGLGQAGIGTLTRAAAVNPNLLSPTDEEPIHWSAPLTEDQVAQWARGDVLVHEDEASLVVVIETVTRAVRDDHRWSGELRSLSDVLARSGEPFSVFPLAVVDRSYPGLTA
jgi:hypothetical protein